MPVNAPREYYVAEERFQKSKSKEERIAALEEMIRLMPRHHGSENALAQLKARLAKMKKESDKKGARHVGIKKEGDAQVCILGLANSGKSTVLRSLTDAKPKIAATPYTTTKPEIGMMDYKGVKIQLVEIPSTFDPEYMSIARGCNAIVIVSNNQSETAIMESVLKNNFIRHDYIVINSYDTDVKKKIWDMLGLIVVWTKKTNTPMSLRRSATIKDFAGRIHKDFVKNFRFARITRNGRVIQAGLNYALQDGDLVDLHMK